MPKDPAETDDMFSTTLDHSKMKSARAAITSFAAQLVKGHLIKSVNITVSKEKGSLHTFTTDKSQSLPDEVFGAETLAQTISILQKDAPLLWDYVFTLATPRSRNRRSRAKNAPEDEKANRANHRPPEIVAAHVISSICFSRNRNAKLLPADNGLLLFACGSNRYLMAHQSRVGSSTSSHTTYKMLEKYAEHDAQVIRKLATSPDSAGILRLDNVQIYVVPRDQRYGNRSHMLIGTAGTFCPLEGFQRGMLDLTEKHQALAEGKRAKFTFHDLYTLIDFNFLTNAAVLVWLEVLLDWVGPLGEAYGSNLREKQRTQGIGTKRRVPRKQTKIFPLPTNSYNETVTKDLHEAIKDFFGHLGQTAESFQPRLILTGGDGLTYERLVQVKNYLQFQEDPFERMDILEPYLEVWHTLWTDLSRIYQAHWVSLTSEDPSALGYGANVTDRKAPGNVNKVDYYAYTDLLEIQLEGHMIDIWGIEFGTDDLIEYFEDLAKQENLPSFEALYIKASRLNSMFGSPDAFHHIIEGDAEEYQAGDCWIPPERDESTMTFGEGTKPKRGPKRHTKAAKEKESVPFTGDETLARSTRLIYDATLSRLATRAVADGDVGCVWECLKTMTFSFAGSSHTKYTGYLLEMICNFELESGPDLRELFFQNWLVCPSGQEHVAGDMFQEHLQDELYQHIQSKNTGFHDKYLRKIIAPNVYRFIRAKKDIHKSHGLTPRHGIHKTPAKTAEKRKLINCYRLEQCHLFRSGRTYEEADRFRVDDLGRGSVSLQTSKLAQWVKDTTWARNLNRNFTAEKLDKEESEVHTFDNPPEGLGADNDVLRDEGFAFDVDGPVNSVIEVETSMDLGLEESDRDSDNGSELSNE
ncbi:hypothetical protein K435DRAFT_928577 [Dendrothele bispora CBS 962.96]|uniref:DUF6589 domain-containing protein n=1 Tax=Dendrothele bispora (strain CBS 962.96) TaxID=1314807 RepID=A0A4S8L6H6_DENBC|nr:hypothetical protein K435DRAFT_928577 [Dendrothele bispora CBS 962.96]